MIPILLYALMASHCLQDLLLGNEAKVTEVTEVRYPRRPFEPDN